MTTTPKRSDIVDRIADILIEDRVELMNENKRLRELLERAKDLAEYWINRECTVNYSQQEYNSWLALGHQSNAMEAIRAAINTEIRHD